MRKLSIRIFAMMLAVAVVITNSNLTNLVLAKSSLENGLHEVTINLWNATTDEVSHANGVLVETADLYVNDAELYLVFEVTTLTMSGVTANLKGLTVEANTAQVIESDQDGNPTKFQIRLDSVKEYYEAKANVAMSFTIPGMDHSAMDVRLKVTIGDDSLKDSSIVTPPVAGEDGSNSGSTDEDDSDSSEDSKPVEVTELDFTTMENGTYEIALDLWHASNDAASMASTAVNKTARIVVKNKKATLYVYTKPMTLGNITASLIDFTYDQNGTYKNAKVVTKSADGKPTSFSLELTNITEYLNVTVNPYIAMMGNQPVEARIKFDLSTFTKAASNTDVTEAPGGSENNDSTDNGTTNNGTTNNDSTNNDSTNNGTTNNGSTDSDSTVDESKDNSSKDEESTDEESTDKDSSDNDSKDNGSTNNNSTNNDASNNGSSNGSTNSGSTNTTTTNSETATSETVASETEETDETEEVEDEEEEVVEVEEATEESEVEESESKESNAAKKETQKTVTSTKVKVVKTLKVISLVLGGGSFATVGSFAIYLNFVKGRVR